MHTTRHRSTPSHGVIPITASIATTYTASSFFATPALALPPAVNDVAIKVVTDPATSFVAGCATGAIIAGLMVSLASRGTKKRLQEQLAETMDALQRAEAATHAAEQLMHEMQLEMGVLNGEPYSPFDYVGNVKLSDTASYGEQEAAAREKVADTLSGTGSSSTYDAYADGNVGEDTQAYDTARENGFDVPAEVPQARQVQPMARAAQEMGKPRISATGSAQAPSWRQATGSSPAQTGAHLGTNAVPQPAASKAASKASRAASRSASQTASQTASHTASHTASSAPTSGRRGLGATGQSVAGRLAERYGRASRHEIVIERAKVLEDTRPHARTVQAAPTMRYFDPKKRADAINRRVPRLDESLFPDMSSIASHDEDTFATAMQAMDRAMGPQREIAYSPTAPSAVGYPSAASYPTPAYTPSAAGYQSAAGFQNTTGYQNTAGYQSTVGYEGAMGYQSTTGFQGTQGIQGTKGLGVTRSDLIAASIPLVVDEQEEHVDELIREEFEINRSGASRRYSRSKLTMIDGGEQSGSVRRGGRHFANVS